MKDNEILDKEILNKFLRFSFVAPILKIEFYIEFCKMYDQLAEKNYQRNVALT